MSVSIALIPVLSLVALVFAYVVWASLRSARIASLRAENARLEQSVIDQDAQLVQTFIVGLIEGQPFGECLEAFKKDRASLIPTATLAEPAGWGNDELQRYAQQCLVEQVAEVNRRLGTAFALTTTTVVGLCVVLSTVVYHFQVQDSPPFLAGNTGPMPPISIADDPFSSTTPLDPVSPPGDSPIDEPDEPQKPDPEEDMEAEGADSSELDSELCNFPSTECNR